MKRPLQPLPGVEVLPLRTPTLPPATHTNSYLLGGEEILWVEPASPDEGEMDVARARLQERLEQGQRLVAILLTHHHPDHIGNVEQLAQSLGVPIWAHPRTASLTGISVGRELLEGDTIELAASETVSAQRWQVLFTPGHASGHICLWEQGLGVQVVGDMVASEGTIIIPPDDGDMGEYLRQLERLKDLAPKLVLPAHGLPVTEPKALFEHYIQHRLKRERNVVAAFGNAPAEASLDDLVQYAYDDTPKVLWGLAKQSLLAHLHKLINEGRVAAAGGRYRLMSS